MTDLPYNRFHQIDGYLTPEEETRILSVREGDKLEIPQGFVKYQHEKFERKNKKDTFDNVITVALNTGLASLPVLSAVNNESAANILVSTIVGAGLSAFYGQPNMNYRMNDTAIKTYKTNLRLIRYLSQIRGAADNASRSNFVEELNARVKGGDTVSLNELAKLVNVDDIHFERACDNLVITVLQAKAMIAIQDGAVEPYKIPSYSSMPLSNFSLIGEHISRESIGHEHLLRLALEDAIKRQIPIKKGEASTTHDEASHMSKPIIETQKTPTSLSELFQTAAKKVASWCVKGWQGNLVGFKDVSAKDYLYPLPTSYSVPTIPAASDLDERIQRMNDELCPEGADVMKFDHLYLPALQRG